MRTLVVLAVGLIVALAFVFVAGHFGKAKVAGALAFIGVWLIFCVIDYSRGLKAGYAAIDELGIHLVLFIIPALGSWAAARFLK